MQFSENWLRSLVNPALDSAGLSHTLTMAGLEVEAMDAVSSAFSHVVVAEILSAEKHPDADRLQICKVNVGAAEPLQIVCGASNVRVGLKTPCALVGSELPGMSIKQAKVRGVESFGMMCSAKELGLVAEASGLLELPNDTAVGLNIREYLDLNDHSITIKLTPNRADCLSILGVARDVAATTGATLNIPQIQAVKVTDDAQKTVRIDAVQACPRYCGRMIRDVNVNVETPEWMVRRLERSGIRSISAVVDITNYVLLELGQPLHAFDADKLNGDIVVRYARAKETLLLLNDMNVELQTDMLVISDQIDTIALAGIMGGEHSAVSDATRHIFLESAFFTPDAIAGKARRLGLSTDSSYRFERGVDFGNTRQALERATQLIVEICGGQVGEVSEIIGTLPTRQPVILRMNRLQSVLGISFESAVVADLLRRLGFVFQQENDVFHVTPPSYRFDIAIEEDLIEEIARLHGYHHLPAILPESISVMLPDNETKLHQNKIRDALTAAGYQEIVTYSFVDTSWEQELVGNAHPIALKNPIASNLSVMRTSLWGGLLETLTYNLNRQQIRAMLFEIGTSYHPYEQGFVEKVLVSGLFHGTYLPEQWGQTEREVDFYDMKMVVDSLAPGAIEYQPAIHAALHPGQSAQLMLSGQVIGWLGKLHPKWQQHYGLNKATFLFELALEPLLAKTLPEYTELAKTLPVRRDLAVLVEANQPVQPMLDAVHHAKFALIKEIKLFDVYQGKGIENNQKSLAFLVLMQDTHKTLQDIEVDHAMSQVVALFKNKFNAVLRT